MTATADQIIAPDPLRDLPGWLTYKTEPHPDKPGKMRKIPYYAASGRRRRGNGTPEDRAQLVDFATAKAALLKGGYAGLGFAPRSDWGIVFTDFDDCIKEGKIDPFVEGLARATYVELSPSGTGAHSITRGNIPNMKDHATADKFGVEVFSSSMFITFTGNPLPECLFMDNCNVIADTPPELAALIRERQNARGEASADAGQVSEDAKFARKMALSNVTKETLFDLRDALMNGIPADLIDAYGTWIEIGEALASLKETPFEIEAVTLWHEVSARSPKYDEGYADMKWDTFRPNRITHLTIFKLAQDNGWTNPRSSQALKTGGAEDYATLEDRTDVGSANMLIRLTGGDLRYVDERGRWLWWDGSKWIADARGKAAFKAALPVAQHFHQVALDLRKQAANPALDEVEQKRISKSAASVERWADQCRSNRGIDAMLAVASKDGRIAVPAADLDCDPWLLGASNGVVCLKTGTLRPAGRDEFVTMRSLVAFDPDAKAPRWRRFVEEITGRPLPVEFSADGHVVPESVGRYEARPALADYFQRVMGYAVTGSTREQKMFFCIGAGCNGKSVALDIIKEILDDYCRTIPPESLMTTRHDADAERPSSVAASLAGCRLAISSESREGQRLDVALVKRHTGGGFLTARLMRENSFTFPITHKLMLQTNSKPALDHLDDAIRGRLHLIPFDRVWNRPGHPEHDPTLPVGDKDLMEALRAEAPGILTWLVEGAVRYTRQGLEPPADVVRMTRSYLSEQDPISRWLDGYDRCDPKRGILASELFRQFQNWHRDEDQGQGQAPENTKAFGQALAGRQVTKHKSESGWLYGLTAKHVPGS